MSEFRVLIVDPDPEVARSHCKAIASQRGFVVVGAATSAGEALAMVGPLKPQLLLLDLDADGLALLRRIRAAGAPIEAIVATACTDARVVRSAMQLGVVDYLVKPFRPERLRQALGLFLRRAATVTGGARLEQDEIDSLVAMRAAPRRWLPKDLQQARLDEIRDALESLGGPLTSDELALRIGVARTTARRYLEYLVTVGEATCEQIPMGPGRPPKAYAPVAPIGGVPVLELVAA
jgi:two-component system response regulator DctR